MPRPYSKSLSGSFLSKELSPKSYEQGLSSSATTRLSPYRPPQSWGPGRVRLTPRLDRRLPPPMPTLLHPDGAADLRRRQPPTGQLSARTNHSSRPARRPGAPTHPLRRCGGRRPRARVFLVGPAPLPHLPVLRRAARFQKPSNAKPPTVPPADGRRVSEAPSHASTSASVPSFPCMCGATRTLP